ncbi:MAG TPA: hypothetical protein VF275_05360 [Gammaproteobacteria bacterium]
MILFSHATTDGVSSEYFVPGGEFVFVAQGSFGGGTASLEYRMQDIPGFIELDSTRFTTNDAAVLTLAPGHVRAVLTGSSGADLNVGLARAEYSGEQPLPEQVALLGPGVLDVDVVVSRDGIATVRNDNGAWESVPVDTARFQHNRAGEVLGLLSEGVRINHLQDSENPAGQTVNIGDTGDFTLWMEGSGSVSVSANTATGSGFGTASEGAPVTFNLSVAGTVDVSISGSVSRFQLEGQQHPSTYIPTPAGAKATRGVELVHVTDISPWYDESGTTFLVQGYAPPTNAANPHAISLNDGGTWQDPLNRLSVRVNSSGILTAEALVNDTAEAALSLGAINHNEFFSVAFRITSDAIAASRDGGQVEVATGISLPTVSRFDIGSAGETAHWYSPLRLVRVYKGALSDQDMQTASGTVGQVPDPGAGTEPGESSLKEGQHQDNTPEPPPKPALGATYEDIVYGTTPMRASNASSQGNNYERNDYSRRNPFNADNTRYLTITSDGWWQLHDAQTGSYIETDFDMTGNPVGNDGSREPHWHPSDPNLLALLGENWGGLTLNYYNVDTGAYGVLADFTSLDSIAGDSGKTSILQVWPSATRLWTRWEGSPSHVTVSSGPNAGWPRYWAFQAESGSHSYNQATHYGIVTYDLQTNRILGVYDYQSDGNGIGAPDHVSISPSGAYVIAGWYNGDACQVASDSDETDFYDDSGQPSGPSSPCGLMAFNNTFTTGKAFHTRGPHADMGYGPTGNDVYVFVDHDWGYVKAYDMVTDTTEKLFRFTWPMAMHISAKNFNKPGWALISTYLNDDQHWYNNKLFAIELKANPRIYMLGHTYNRYEGYWTEVHAAVNGDFTRVLFNSNFTNDPNSATPTSDAYMITLAPTDIPDAEP